MHIWKLISLPLQAFCTNQSIYNVTTYLINRYMYSQVIFSLCYCVTDVPVNKCTYTHIKYLL